MDDRDTMIAGIVSSLHRIQHLMAADRSNPLLKSTLTMQQLKVLLVLSNSDGASGQELASAMGVSLATMTGIIDRMVAAGLVDRHEDPHDRRVRRVQLTDAGRKTFDEFVTAGQESVLEIVRRLDDEELRVVARAMRLMTDAAAEQLRERQSVNETSPPAGGTATTGPAGGRRVGGRAERRRRFAR